MHLGPVQPLLISILVAAGRRPGSLLLLQGLAVAPPTAAPPTRRIGSQHGIGSVVLCNSNSFTATAATFYSFIFVWFDGGATVHNSAAGPTNSLSVFV